MTFRVFVGLNWSADCSGRSRHFARELKIIENSGPMAYERPAKWRKNEIALDLVDDSSEGAVATIGVRVGAIELLIMGEILEDGERLVVTGVHISSMGVKPNDIGFVNLRQVALAVMERGKYDEVVIQGAVRTTGARPQHKPRPVRFSRNSVIALESKPRGGFDD